MNALLSLWAWAEIALVATLGFLVQVPLFLVTVAWDRRRAVAGRWFRWMGVLSAKLNPFWDFAVDGPIPSVHPRKTVVVSNHESNADAFLISLLPWEMKWLGKSTLFWVPVVGWSMWVAGDVRVKRGDRDSAQAAMKQCARWLARGMPVMIFPEGTRSTTNEMLPFKDGAFRLAIDAGADILPLAVSGTRASLPKNSWRFSRARGRVRVGERIPTSGMTVADVETLKREARARIEVLRQTVRGEAA
jgi:1-acyl-sn-glycerol-3-phosphate acyltransferase